MIDIGTLTATQRQVLRELARAPNYSDAMGGNGRAPFLSAARALARKGILQTWRTGYYAVAMDYRNMADAELARWREMRKQTKESANGTR